MLYLHQQRALNTVTPGADGDGMRIRQHRIAISASGNRLALSSTAVFAQPSLWVDGKGFNAAPTLLKLALGAEAGRVICVYNQNDAVSQLQADRNEFYNVYMKYSDDDGATWSSATKIVDCADITGGPANYVAI
jgi:hypothetical protein